MAVQGNVYVVTGGGNGIGRETVLALLARGAKVAAVDLSKEALEETVKLAGAGDALSTHVMNISDKDAVAKLPAAVIKQHGQVDGLLNIAGIIQQFVHFNDLELAEIEKVINVNLWGTIYLNKAFLPELLKRPSASLLNVSSMGGLAPVPGQAVYGATKAAVKLLTEALYAELRETNIKVTVVFPGGVSTNIAGNSGVGLGGGQDAETAASQTKMVMTTPQDAARQIVDAVDRGTLRVVIGKDARSLDKLSRLMPKKAIDIIADKMKSLLG